LNLHKAQKQKVQTNNENTPFHCSKKSQKQKQKESIKERLFLLLKNKINSHQITKQIITKKNGQKKQ